MFLFGFFTLCTARIRELNDHNYNNVLKKTTFSVVLLSSFTFSDHQVIKNVFETVSCNYNGKVDFLYCSVDKNHELRKKFNVLETSFLFLFHREELITQYFGKYNIQSITKFVNDIGDGQFIQYPNSLIEVIEFQKLTPANIILTSDKLIHIADSIAQNCTQLIHVAVVQNQQIIKKMKLPPILYNKPKEFITKSFNDDIKISYLIKLSQPNWKYIKNQNLIGKRTLVALYDQSKPFHMYKINDLFGMVKNNLPNKFDFVAIDFFDAPKFVKKFGLLKFDFPIFFTIGNTKKNIDLCLKPKDPAKTIFYWVRKVLTGEAEPTKNEIIPTLSAYDFSKNVITPKYDVILYVASPDMYHYKEGKENAETLATVFKECKLIKFYEFNPKTEHVQGLELPLSNYPQFSIWPASKEMGGKSFRADYELKEMLEKMLTFFKAPIDNESAQKTFNAAKRLIPGM